MHECFLEFLQKMPSATQKKYREQWAPELVPCVLSFFLAAGGVGVAGFCFTYFVEPYAGRFFSKTSPETLCIMRYVVHLSFGRGQDNGYGVRRCRHK